MSLVMVEGQLAWNEFWDDHFLYSKKKDGINSWILGFNSLKISQTVHVKNTHAPFYCSKQNAQKTREKRMRYDRNTFRAPIYGTKFVD